MLKKILVFLLVGLLIFPVPVLAQAPVGPPVNTAPHPQPVVAIQVSELTQALESMPAAGTDTPQPPAFPGTSGFQWFNSAWHYFVIYESLIEALRSDGTPYVTVSDAQIRSGELIQADGLPKYPILFSLAAEAVSDDEISPLRDYVSAGGFLFAGSSAFTRRPDGSSRGDFALADEMGLHMVHPDLQNWVLNTQFSKVGNHRLVAHIPAGKLSWYMPKTATEVPWGTSYYGHPLHEEHYDFQVQAVGAEVIANGSHSLLLATKTYGSGTFIYHADFQPLIGFGGSDSGMYAYGIYRNAIEWAFEAANLPIVRLSPWQYQYNAAFILRHDLENTAGQIIENSAKAEAAAGARGDYYFCTGVLRDQLKNDPIIVASLRRAVSLYGATIGPHNGGLKNPNNVSLTYAALDYWHWGPDEAINGTPAGFNYALKSVSISFQDIERWLAGLDNGRPGCGAAGNCPRIWVSPYFNSASEQSNQILQQLNALTMGEQKLSPFPHFTLSTQSEGLVFPQVSLPVSDWYINGKIAQSIESGHSVLSVRALVDAYYRMGALVNLYGHASSASGLTNEYMRYSLAKPRMWAANSVMIADWWQARSGVSVLPTFAKNGDLAIASAAISGASDPDTAIELKMPGWNIDTAASLQVFLDGSPADTADFRITVTGLKIKVGSTVHEVEVRYRIDLPASSLFSLFPALFFTQTPASSDYCWKPSLLTLHCK